MLLQSPDGQVLLNCPEPHHQSRRRDCPASDQVYVRVPLGVGSRFAQKIGPGREEYGRKENAEIAVFFHFCLAERCLRLVGKFRLCKHLPFDGTLLSYLGHLIPSMSKR